jgi:hypothetical protein
MTSKSKSKGNSWERDIAEFLSAEYNEPFLRVQTSGAYVGGKNAHRKQNMSQGQILNRKGDIVPPDNWKHLNIEAKFYKEFPFHHLFDNSNIPLFEDWIEQINISSEENDLKLIFMKFNRKGAYVLYPITFPVMNVKSVRYKDFLFTNWDSFWSTHTKMIVKEAAINSMGAFSQYNLIPAEQCPI